MTFLRKMSNYVQILIVCLLAVDTAHTVSSYKLIRFGGAGIYYWWQAGAASYLQEQRLDFSQAHLLGASAGSITSAMLFGEGCFSKGAIIAIQKAKEGDVWNKKSGLAGVWAPMIRLYMEELIQEEALFSDDRMQRLHISLTPRKLVAGTKIVSNFTGKADLIDAVMASVHIPFFMNGRYSTTFRGKKYVDGSLWSFITKRKGPLPRSLGPLSWEKDILDIRFQDDTKLTEQINQRGSFVKLITPEGLYNLMDLGYQYAKNLEKEGKLQFLPKRTNRS